MRYVIVTGAAGMIGSGIVRHLNDLGVTKLLLVDDLKKTDKWKNLIGKQFVDLISKHQLWDWLARCEEVDAIFHMGACSNTTETDVDYLLENNFKYTIRLAEWALKRDVRFIYASSASTYGDGALGFSEEEIEKLKPLNPYAFSKQLTDLWMKREGVLNRVVALKYFNVFGPNENHKGAMASMVFKMWHKVARDGEVSLFKSNDPKYADGGQMRDFIYVKDAVRMTCAFLEPKYRNLGGIFNIGQGKPTTWNLLAEALFKALEKKAKITYIDMPPELARQYQNYTCARMEKLHSVFESVQTTPLSEAVHDYVNNYLLVENRW
jgi:ADP-L-glycero-D-manno-heptose 6-epimerase